MTGNREQLLKMLLDNIPDSGERCAVCTFPTENDALAYAYRLTQLKPGTRCLYADLRERNAVFSCGKTRRAEE